MLKVKQPKGEPTFAELLQVRPHHLRSVEIARDFEDPGATLHYVVTPFVSAATERISQGFAVNSTARAWRLTGDYGSGKSSFALALARLAAAQAELLPTGLQKFRSPQRLEPVLVVGEREPIGRSVLRALRCTLARRLNARALKLIDFAEGEPNPHPERVIGIVEEASRQLKNRGLADGLFVVLDELGKNLEHAVEAVDADDVYLLQRLAEHAARSGGAPIIVVAILHQAVAMYAAALPSAQRREWEKVAGRFEEVVFAPPLEQTALLVASALDVDCPALPKRLASSARATMGRAADIGWYGVAAARAPLVDLAPSVLPLDPAALPVLARLLRRFGQNERSLFSFLSSREPFGLMSHAQAALGTIQPYRLHNLYDYVSANLSTFLSSGPQATRWGIIEDTVRSAVVDPGIELALLKTVALLNLLDEPGLPATRDAVTLAVVGVDKLAQTKASRALDRLIRHTRLLYDRGRAGALCLWPHTSVDLDDAFAHACEVVGHAPPLDSLSALLPAEPLVARRHYVQTGALRHFELTYCAVANLKSALEKRPAVSPSEPDGSILIALSATESERAEALKIVEHHAPNLPRRFLVGVARPVGGLAPLIRDVEAWSWVQENTAALAGDRLARTEVSRQLSLARDRLSRAITATLDVRGPAAGAMIWTNGGRSLSLASGRALLAYLSDLCDVLFAASPKVRNELINRRALSSAAARARFLLIEKLATAADQPMLGLEPDRGTPPELAVYLSVLRAGQVHVERDGRWQVTVPDESNDPLRLRPALHRIGEVLRSAKDRQVAYEELSAEMAAQPYGARAGLIPVLIAIYLAAHWHQTAVYEDGTYLIQVGGPEFNRIVKEPEHFTFQHCAIEGVRAEVFVKLAEAVGLNPSPKLDLLDVVRPLVTFVARLPDHARRTRQLSAITVAVRTALLDASDPTALIFRALPHACGLDPITIEAAPPEAVVEAYVQSMASAVRELRGAYDNLLKRIAASLGAALNGPAILADLRPEFSDRAQRLLKGLTEPELKAFALRLADSGLDDKGWLESLASFVARKPPERWADSDEAEYHHRLPILSRRLGHVEATLFGGGSMENGQFAYRLLVTAGDGREVEQVYRAVPKDAAALATLEQELRGFLELRGGLAKLAAARVLMSMIAAETGVLQSSAEQISSESNCPELVQTDAP